MYYEINKTTKEHRIVKPQPMGQRGYIAPPRPGWRRVEADEDGWIGHYGGGCPLPDGVRFDAVMQDGEVALDEPPCPDSAWYHQWGSADIVKYRPILDAPIEPEAPKWDGESWPPPIGSVVKSYSAGGKISTEEVLAVRDGRVIGFTADEGVPKVLRKELCSPGRPNRRRTEDALLHAYMEGAKGHHGGIRAIYDAIQDGEIPGVSLDD